MSMRTVFAAALLGALALPAQAAVTGQVGVASDYLFRGLDFSSGAAVNGSLDYQAPNGAYSGLRARNCSVCGGTEADLYAGWAGKVYGELGVDAGLVYYLYSESDEYDGGHSSYAEAHLGVSAYGLSADFYYAPSYRGIESTGGGNRDGYYGSLSYGYGFGDGLNLTGHVGYSWGDGVKKAIGDKYTDYRLTLAKTLDKGFSAQVTVVGTDLDGRLPSGAKFKDKPKFVVGLAKSFSF